MSLVKVKKKQIKKSDLVNKTVDSSSFFKLYLTKKKKHIKQWWKDPYAKDVLLNNFKNKWFILISFMIGIALLAMIILGIVGYLGTPNP
ncbi:hypothetical protein MCAV_08200 [[Mycoplasma] cavipharyngis]|uniref:hypothetical protein n=1 Tax=[Mycoplasma] cavipharyngis TaxID=92757 RepID=UPI003703B8C6